jgi:glutamate N-acetyltransferase / amino-acid N-acetyltransferase
MSAQMAGQPAAQTTSSSGVGVTAPRGFRAAGVAAGLKTTGKPDVALVVNDGPLQVAAAVTSSNRVFAAPVAWTRVAVANGNARAVVLNPGGANACTGAPGYSDAAATAAEVARLLDEADRAAQSTAPGAGETALRARSSNVPPDLRNFDLPAMQGLGDTIRIEQRPQRQRTTPTDVIVCSTGLIGVRLPMAKIIAGIDDAFAALSDDADAGLDAARAIMTTDTRPKITVQRTGNSNGWTIGGMAKGAGMLAPGLATMLCVLTTDADVSAELAASALKTASAATFDRIDSDGCMSTNDTVTLLASGASGERPSPDEFVAVLTAACADLARQLIADAEGASHDIAVVVRGAASESAAVAVGRAVARSNLLKAAVFGNDPNWGRVLAALGTVPESVAAFAADTVDVSINGVQVCRAGGVGEPRELVDLAAAREVLIEIELHAGEKSATIWTNDLTHDYVTENSAYSS